MSGAGTGDCAATAVSDAKPQSAVANRRSFMNGNMPRAIIRSSPRTAFAGQAERSSGVPAQDRFRYCRGVGRQRWRGLVNRMAVLALFLGDVERVVGGRDQSVRECADLAGPLRDTDRDRQRNILPDAGGGVGAA